MRADLHIHTTASDGSWGPEQLIAEIKQKNIGLFAVTDHDTTANLPLVGELAREAGLVFISGVEISATLHNQSFHILGYGINYGDIALQRLLKHNTELMEEVDQDSIKKLIADGFAIDYDEYCAYKHDPARGGWKSLSFLIDKGFCQDVNEFFAKLFTAERGIVFPEFKHPAEVIKVIKDAGGYAVLAHPGSDFHGTRLDETLDYFAGEEIDGIECFHPSHCEQTVSQAVAWCIRHGLLITGGSDCHGDFVPRRRLGIPEITLNDLQLGTLIESINKDAL